MTNTLQKRSGDEQRLILILAFDGVTLSDVASPSDVFDLTSRYVLKSDALGYRVVVTSLDGGSIRTSCGIKIHTQPIGDFSISEVDTLLVPGGGPPTAPPVPEGVVTWLRIHAPTIRRVCAICTGAFLLAAAGLADGHRITTHWDATKLLEERFPLVTVEHDCLFVHDGALWSSAGFSAGFDLALAIVEGDFGYAIAIEVAKLLVLFLKRPGDQTQYSLPLAAQSARDPDFSKLHAWISNNLNANLTVEALAERVGMSPRTFARRYAERIGTTPAKTVEALRTDAVLRRIREPHSSLKEVARDCGFGDEQTLRRAFIRRFGYPPSDQDSLDASDSAAA